LELGPVNGEAVGGMGERAKTEGSE
jgi:hypothetical protein